MTWLLGGVVLALTTGLVTLIFVNRSRSGRLDKLHDNSLSLVERLGKRAATILELQYNIERSSEQFASLEHDLASQIKRLREQLAAANDRLTSARKALNDALTKGAVDPTVALKFLDDELLQVAERLAARAHPSGDDADSVPAGEAPGPDHPDETP